jgi:starch phosphorylase
MEKSSLKFRSAPLADIELPKEADRLRDLAYNLWWTWNPQARRMFSHIQPGLWAMYRNPVELLINIDPHHWETLLEDDVFLTMYQSVLREFDTYMRSVSTSWFAKNHPNYQGGPFVYFSTEFGFHESLHTYSGGLGVLSGDHCKSASDLGLPFIAIGPLYKNGYFEQEVEPDGRQQHFYPAYDFSRLPITPLLGDDGRQLTVSVKFPDRKIYVRVWLTQVGRVPVLLLDTDTTKNEPADRPITGQLYVSGREMRICQEIVIGMGGVQVLQALGIEPSSWHMNEGHCAFLVFERIRAYVKHGLSFEDACKEITKSSIFTTHTPVPAGNEAFDIDLIKKYFKGFCEEVGVRMDKLIEMGLSNPSSGQQPFSLTVLALHLSSYSNGVSQLHGTISNEMWRHVFNPDAARRGKSHEQPIKAITNGVHTQTWLGFQMSELLDRYLTPAWRENLMDAMFWKRGVANIPDKELWDVHNLQKENLIRFARGRVRTQLARHGSSPDELRAVDELLNPEALTIGFARRFATYKRADLLFRDFDRLRAILKDAERPVQILFAGKAHPADKPGQELIRRIFEISRHSDLIGHIVFLENYNMRLARMLVQGVDVWLNTPRRPHEASGTSGMKGPVNGCINFSIADGWWCEIQNPDAGWTIGNGQQLDNSDVQDQHDSESLYELLEDKIVPIYYQRNEEGLPTGWIRMMKASMATVTPRFSTARMVRDYVEQAYLPAAKRAGAVTVPAEQSW